MYETDSNISSIKYGVDVVNGISDGLDKISDDASIKLQYGKIIYTLLNEKLRKYDNEIKKTLQKITGEKDDCDRNACK